MRERSWVVFARRRRFAIRLAISWAGRFFQREWRPEVLRPDSDLIWWEVWYGALDCRSAAPPAMRLIRRGTWGRGWRMRYFRLRARADRTGPTPPFRCSGR